MDVLTLDMILDLPREVVKKSVQYNEYSELLRKDIYKEYDLKKLKKDIEKEFNHFKDAKYLYKFPIDYNIKVTPNYTFREGDNSNKISDPTSNTITGIVDEQIWMFNFYNSLMTLALKLTMQESIYMVDTFFSKKSEDIISEKLGICRNTLQNIKKSCLVKIGFEFQLL